MICEEVLSLGEGVWVEDHGRGLTYWHSTGGCYAVKAVLGGLLARVRLLGNILVEDHAGGFVLVAHHEKVPSIEQQS